MNMSGSNGVDGDVSTDAPNATSPAAAAASSSSFAMVFPAAVFQRHWFRAPPPDFLPFPVESVSNGTAGGEGERDDAATPVSAASLTADQQRLLLQLNSQQSELYDWLHAITQGVCSSNRDAYTPTLLRAMKQQQQQQHQRRQQQTSQETMDVAEEKEEGKSKNVQRDY
jgi:hypothetical protein